MSLIQDLKAKYPNAGFEQDPESAIIGFSFEDMWITDPFISECGRFSMPPSYYGIESLDAYKIITHNMPLEMCQ